MVTKWKNISEKWCGKRRKRVMLWAVLLDSLLLFFWGLGFAASGDVGLRSFTYIGDDANNYLSSQYHADEVWASFQEVHNNCMEEREFDGFWGFQGIYEFRLAGQSHLNQNNVPKQAVDDFIKELGKEVSDDDEGVVKFNEVPAAVQDEVRRGELSWYFRNNVPCYYRWDGTNYSVNGDLGFLPYDLIGKMNPMGADEKITIGFTEQMLQVGERQYDGIRFRFYSGCLAMFVGVCLLFAALFLLIPDLYRNRRGRSYYDILALAVLLALYLLPGRIRELILPSYRWTEDGIEILKELFPIACSVTLVFGMLLISVVNFVCLGAGLRRTGLGGRSFLSTWKRDRGFIYRIIACARQKITGEAYAKEGIVQCTRKRLRFTRFLTAALIFSGLVSISTWDWHILGWWFDLFVFCVMLGWVWHAQHVGTKKIRSAYVQLLGQIDRICEESYELPQEMSEFSLFDEEMKKLSMLSCRMQENIKKQVQAERMKMDLITNVSHDLKTPLTSLISYIDLLSKEDLPPAAVDYVKVLGGKSEQLRKMVADVFDLAKASSGNLEVKEERVELNRLLIQTMADMEGEIEKAPVKVVTQLSESVAVLKSDGDKLYRVFQNVIQNALKYSMRGTRVFVTLTVEKREAVLCVKNVADYEMDFTAEEVMGRFFRGDKARSTEGSGLGLAIAKEFSECCGGVLSVEISGDVFCVHIRFGCFDVITV